LLLSVIIPALNEAAGIATCLKQFGDEVDVEVLVLDGGSTDRTGEVVAESGLGTLVPSPGPGRARQMNHGAASAAGEVFLFLHADTLLPPNGLELIRATMRDPAVVGGRFSLSLPDGGLLFRLIGRLSTLRSRHLGITYGDQAIFVERGAFEAAGGFPIKRIFEDSELCTKLSRAGRFVLLDAAVRTSARRWRRSGILRTILLMWGLRALYIFSVSDDRLSRWYRDVR
jgi:rSAM/selenodomain-associated transferase 2